jgi:fido (protein-threonine AMPylation protein)
MGFVPDYGDTPLSGDELDSLLPRVAELLGAHPDKAALYDLEQAIHVTVAQELMTDVLTGRLSFDAIVTGRFVRDLHRELYGEIWTWAGVFRRHEINLGVAPELIPTETTSSLATLNFRWRNTADWTPHQFGIGVHAEILRIHPFADGNGRTSRLVADLIFLATQDTESLYLYDWLMDKARYVSLLREYDRHRNPAFLAEFINPRSLEE